MPNRSRILGLATAWPEHVIGQQDVEAYCSRIFGGDDQWFARLAAVYGNTGIELRHVCMPLEWYAGPHGWPERMGLFESHALDLLEAAADRALAVAELAPSEIDAVLTICTTGFTTPSLDALLIDRMGLRSDVRRLPIFGLGCAGGVLGLARADESARATPGANVLLLGVELCSLTFRAQEQSKANVVASALFGDGAAAVVLSAGDGAARPSLPELLGAGEHTWPGSRDVMGWRVEDDGFGVVFSRHIPALIRRDFKGVVAEFLRRGESPQSHLAGYLFHPGGGKVLAAYEQALGLGPDDLRHSREVLRTCGNVSSISVLAVLERALGDARPGPHLMAALGPGFTAAMMLIDLPAQD